MQMESDVLRIGLRFLLTNVLLDELKASAPARVVNVAGDFHRKATIQLDDLMSEKDYSGIRANNQAKLALILFTYELARRLDGPVFGAKKPVFGRLRYRLNYVFCSREGQPGHQRGSRAGGRPQAEMSPVKQGSFPHAHQAKMATGG